MILKKFGGAKIISSISIFSRKNKFGSVYAEVPFKDRAVDWFYNIDNHVDDVDVKFYARVSEVASHGLLHVDHTKISRDAQEMSILTSCSMLKSDLFVPPFNKYNDITKEICIMNGIKLVNEMGKWKNIEYENFDINHPYWYFHSWRWTPGSLKEKLSGANNL